MKFWLMSINLFKVGSKTTPQIDFNKFTGELILFGRSLPEDAGKVYEPLHSWVSEYIKEPRKITNLRLNLEYFNSATSVWLAKIISTLSKIDIKDSILMIHIYLDTDNFEDLENKIIRDILRISMDNMAGSNVSIEAKTYGRSKDGYIISGSKIMFSSVH